MQLVQPDLDPYIIGSDGKPITDWLGWCLGYVRAAFRAPNAGYCAWDAWTGTTQFKHEDRDFPEGVYFILWFKHWGTYYDERIRKNRTGDWGHVVIGHVDPVSRQLTIHSSPISHKAVADTWTSIVEVESKYNSTYVGWSEDIAGLRVISGNVQGEDNVITDEDLAPVRILMSEVEGWPGNEIHSGADDAQIMGAWKGHTWQEMIWHGWNVQSNHRQSLVDTINAQQATIQQIQQALDAANTGTTQTKADYQTAVAKISDLTKDLAAKQAEIDNLVANPKVVYTVDTQTRDNVAANLKVSKSIQGSLSNFIGWVKTKFGR